MKLQGCSKVAGTFFSITITRCTSILVLLFIILSAVFTHAQTPLKPLFPTRQPEASKDSLPEDSAQQTEVNEDSLPVYTDEQTEMSEDSPPEDSSEQTEVSLPYHSEVVRHDSPPMHSTVKPDFFIAPLAEVIGYGLENPSFGAGFALGAGNGVAIGARFFYTIDSESLHTIELAVFLRLYLRGHEVCTGPFVQIIIGAALHTHKHGALAFAGSGAISAGIAAGWRFPLGKRWYIEPSVRAGYPYIAGVGVSFAFRI